MYCLDWHGDTGNAPRASTSTVKQSKEGVDSIRGWFGWPATHAHANAFLPNDTPFYFPFDYRSSSCCVIPPPSTKASLSLSLSLLQRGCHRLRIYQLFGRKGPSKNKKKRNRWASRVFSRSLFAFGALQRQSLESLVFSSSHPPLSKKGRKGAADVSSSPSPKMEVGDD